MSNKKRNYIWVYPVAFFAILLICAGALYAQGYGQRGQGGQGGRGMGPGMDMGQGMGPGSEMGQGMGMGGHMGMGQRMGGMAYLMEDPEIRDLVGQIKIISGINELGLTADQVRILLDCSRQMQSLMDSQLGDARGQVKDLLNAQLENVMRGGEFDRSVFENLRTEMQASHDPGQMREQCRPIIERALGVLTDEQKEKLNQPERMDGMMGGMMGGQGDGQQGGMRHERMQNRRNNMPDRPGLEQWLGSLDEDQRAQVEQRFENRMGQMGGQMGERMGNRKLMMMLMSPATIPALEKWLEAHK